MSNAVVQIKRPDHAAEEHPDPLRQQLAGAIAAEAEARSALNRAEEALRRGHAVVAASEAKLASALRHVEVCKDNDARRTAAAVRNRPGATPDASNVRRARLAAVEAEDNLEVSQGAVARIQEELEAARDAARWASNAVLACRNACIAPVIVAVIDRAREARMTLAVSRALASELLARDDRGPEFPDEMDGFRARDARLKPLAGLKVEAERLLMLLGSTSEEQSAAAEATAAMRQAFSKLTTDASVEIPLP